MSKYSDFKDQLNLNPNLAVSGQYSGKTADMLVNTNSVGEFAALCWTADGYVNADADAEATMPCSAIALEAGTGTKKVFLKGFIRNDAWSFTKGLVYVSTDTGVFTQTAPAGEDDVFQIVGFAYDTNILYFVPTNTTVTLAAS